MLTLEQIKEKFLRGERENTLDAAERMIERRITFNEITEATETAECIELYPQDK